jgi:hypothetical protein
MSSARSATTRCGSFAGIGNDEASLLGISVTDGFGVIEDEPPANRSAVVARSPKRLLQGRESLIVRSFRNVS